MSIDTINTIGAYTTLLILALGLANIPRFIRHFLLMRRSAAFLGRVKKLRAARLSVIASGNDEQLEALIRDVKGVMDEMEVLKKQAGVYEK